MRQQKGNPVIFLTLLAAIGLSYMDKISSQVTVSLLSLCLGFILGKANAIYESRRIM
jgi:ascorbate-specific PTS system EIIC-type component UlaA